MHCGAVGNQQTDFKAVENLAILSRMEIIRDRRSLCRPLTTLAICLIQPVAMFAWRLFAAIRIGALTIAATIGQLQTITVICPWVACRVFRNAENVPIHIRVVAARFPRPSFAVVLAVPVVE